MDMKAAKAGLLAVLRALEGPAETAVETVVAAANPVVGAIVTEAVDVVESVFRKTPAGIAAAATASPVAPVAPAATPSVDVTKSPLTVVPTDLASCITFVVALADKVDALTAATGMQGSAAMADHA